MAKKTMTVTEAMEHGGIIERREYPAFEQDGTPINVIIIETPNGEYIDDNGYVSPIYVRVINGDTACSRSKETLADGTIVGIISKKAPRRQTGNALLYSILYSYASMALSEYKIKPDILHIAVCIYLMDMRGLRRNEVMRAFKAVNRRHEKDVSAYLRSVERDRKKSPLGLLDTVASLSGIHPRKATRYKNTEADELMSNFVSDEQSPEDAAATS